MKDLAQKIEQIRRMLMRDVWNSEPFDDKRDQLALITIIKFAKKAKQKPIEAVIEGIETVIEVFELW